jgi:hypothetical protein
MRAQRISHIERTFDPARLPAPAWVGGPISAFDSLALYTMLAEFRPRRYVEIGSGMTTCFARQAITDLRLPTRIISIDPEPRAEIDSICDEVLRVGLETCDLKFVDELQRDDILFFDGTHRTFMNSDVTVFIIDVLPRLKPGVIVHVHDIHLPYDYPEWARNWYWNEQYMLAVYMMCSSHRINPLLPTAFVCGSGLFENEIARPFVDLGPDNTAWRGGGSMWFTHTTRFRRLIDALVIASLSASRN